MQTPIFGMTAIAPMRLKSIGAILLTLALGSPAFASLGGNLSSVETDGAQMKATVTMTEGQGYTVHQIKAQTGTVVREYVSPEGRVFGVTWQGPFIPSMQQLLGTYFKQYTAGVKAQHDAGPGRRPLSIQQPNLVVHNTGHMRSFYGRAYDPGLLPEGITANTIR
jgi:hypothetical protein